MDYIWEPVLSFLVIYSKNIPINNFIESIIQTVNKKKIVIIRLLKQLKMYCRSRKYTVNYALNFY